MEDITLKPSDVRIAEVPLCGPTENCGYVSAANREASGQLRTMGLHPGATLALPLEVERLYQEARERALPRAGGGEQTLDAEGQEIVVLLAAGWRRAPWVRLGDGSSDWVAPDGRRCTRNEALERVAVPGPATPGGPGGTQSSSAQGK